MRTWLTMRLAVVTAACLVLSGFAVTPAQAEGDLEAPVTVEVAVETDDTTITEIEMLAVADPAEHLEEAIEFTVEEQVEAHTAEVAVVELNSDIAVVGVSWSDDEPAPSLVEARTIFEGRAGEWVQLEVADDAEVVSGGRSATEPLSVTDVDAVEVVAHYAENQVRTSFALTVIDPRGAEPVQNELITSERSVLSTETLPAVAATSNTTTSIDTGSDFGLRIRARNEWGANEALRNQNYKEKAKYQGAVVHHTAHAGNDIAKANSYREDQVPGLIRSFYAYHVSLGWDDIGYQLLVDRFGNVWEGRHGSLVDSPRGAHAYGANGQTFGISVIGDFRTEAPSAAAQDATARAIAWMFDKHGINDPNGGIVLPSFPGYVGRAVPVLSGHLQMGTGTACPGAAFFAKLPEMRSKVDRYLDIPMTERLLRHAGADRFETAAKTALASHPAGVDTVYIANGLDFPDALAAGPAASAAGAPTLLVLRDSIPAKTLEALKSLRPKKAIVLGQTGVVGASVVKSIEALGAKVTRYGGKDRYETAAQISLAQFSAAKTVYLASGENFPDALAGVPIAGVEDAPLLLTMANSLPAATENALKKLRPETVIVLGGTGVVTDQVQKKVASVTGAKKITRHAGSDRFDTAASVALSKYSTNADVVYVAAGGGFADALAAGPAAALNGAPLLLVESNSLPAKTQAALQKLKPKQIVVLGGTGVITRVNERALDKYIVN